MKLPVPSKLAAAGCLFLIAGAVSVEAAVLYQIPTFATAIGQNSANGGSAYEASLVGVITTADGVSGTTAAELGSLETVASRFQNNKAFDGSQTLGSLITDSVGYFQFGITADTPGTLVGESLVFNARQATGTSGGRGYSIQVSVDGGSYTPLSSALVPAIRGEAASEFNLPLTGAQYTGATSIDFRVTSTDGGIEYNTFTINGDVIPEPSSLGLAMVGALALLSSRRRPR